MDFPYISLFPNICSLIFAYFYIFLPIFATHPRIYDKGSLIVYTFNPREVKILGHVLRPRCPANGHTGDGRSMLTCLRGIKHMPIASQNGRSWALHGCVSASA